MQQHERLKQARIEKGFRTGSEAAKAMGVSVATYNAHENGHRGFSVTAAAKYGYFFDVRGSWLLTGEEPKHHMSAEELEAGRSSQELNRTWGRFKPGRNYLGNPERAVPEVDPFNTEPDDDLPESFGVVADWSIPTDFAQNVLKAKVADLFLLAIKDNIMANLAKAGDRVLADSSHSTIRGSGYYVLKDRDGHLHVRRIIKLLAPEDGKDFHMSTDEPPNGTLVTIDRLRVAGKVVGVISAV